MLNKNTLRTPLRGVIVSKHVSLDQLRLKIEFHPHRTPQNFYPYTTANLRLEKHLIGISSWYTGQHVSLIRSIATEK